MALEMASSMRGHGTTVAFASCEMRKEMVAKFQKRLKADHPIKVITDKIVKTRSGQTRIPFASHVPTLIETCNRIRKQNPGRPFVLIVDSLQELDDGHFKSGRKTSKTAYRALEHLNNYCKQTECALIVIGQVTKSGQMTTVRLVPAGAPVENFAFDVTPARLVTGLITERGVCNASREGLLGLYPEHSETAA